MSYDPEKDPLLMDHEADGIKELDNLLPRWWVWLFYGCIIYSVAYMGYYHVFGIGDSSAEAYEKDMAIANEIKAKAAAEFASKVDTTQPSTDPAVIESGKTTYVTYCAACHRPDGGGLVGPNITDDYWIHGPEFADSIRIITKGNPIKGMIAWEAQLNPQEIHAVASYIYTLRGTNPPNPKPAENVAGGAVPAGVPAVAAPVEEEFSEFE